MARRRVSFYAKSRQGRKVKVTFYARQPKPTKVRRKTTKKRR